MTTRLQNGIIAPRLHYRIDPANFSHGLVGPPRNSFYATDLSEALQSIAKSDPFSKLKPYQLNILYSPIPNLHGNDEALKHFLTQWFDIFNTAFYGGAVQIMRDWLFLVTEVEAGSDKGYFEFHEPLDESFIAIQKNYVPYPYEKTTPEECFLGTLVHEMLHAFLWFFTCDCGSCKNAQHPSLGGFGKKGHGPAWIEAMLVIGQTLQNAVQWRVNVGLVNSIKKEMQVSNWEPMAQDVRRWRITPTRFNDGNGEFSRYGWLKNSRRKDWELQRPDRDELNRRRKEEEDKRDEEISIKWQNILGWYLNEGLPLGVPHPDIWEQDELRIEIEMRDRAQEYVALKGGRKNFMVIETPAAKEIRKGRENQEMSDKIQILATLEREKQRKAQERDRSRHGTTSTGTSRDQQERKRREETERPGESQEWLEQQQTADQVPEMNSKKEQLAPLPRRRPAKGSSGPRRASTADSPQRRADDPEVAKERSMRRKIKETSRKLWNWRR